MTSDNEADAATAYKIRRTVAGHTLRRLKALADEAEQAEQDARNLVPRILAFAFAAALAFVLALLLWRGGN